MMKTAIGLGSAIIIAAAVVHFITRSHFEGKLQDTQADLTEESTAKLRKAARDVERAGGSVEIIETTRTREVQAVVDPAQVLADLAALEIDPRRRNASLWQVVHHLEQLKGLGSDALPAMEEFLATGQDCSYAQTYNRGVDFNQGYNATVIRTTVKGNNNNAQPTRTYTYHNTAFGNAQSGYLVPPSLRMGLYQLAAEQGTDMAEQILVGALGTASRGEEVSYLDILLNRLAPNQYKNLSLTVAKELIRTPNPEASGDYRNKQHLYSVLTRHRDVTFAREAAGLLITEEGRVEYNALNYINSMLKADAVPILAKAAQDPRLQDSQKNQLLSSLMRYAGMHPESDKLFRELVARPLSLKENQNYYHSNLYRSVSQLGYSADAETAKKRRELIKSVRESVTDENKLKILDNLDKQLERRSRNGNNSNIFWNYQSGEKAAGRVARGSQPTVARAAD